MEQPDVTIRSVWPTGAEFLEHFVDSEPAQFFCAIPADRSLPPGGIGALISVLIAFEDRDAEFHVHARIIDRREGTVKRGLTLEIIPEERERLEVVLIAARGESLPYRRRRHTRIPCSYACQVVNDSGSRWRGHATNVNEGGMHAAIEGSLPEAGSFVEVDLTLPDQRHLHVRARVVDAILAGPQMGIGLEFWFTSKTQRDEVQDHIAVLRARARRDSSGHA